MNDQDFNAATAALRAWFISQDIMPSNAGPIMIHIIAELLVTKSRELEKLNEAIGEFNNLLTFEVARCLEAGANEPD